MSHPYAQAALARERQNILLAEAEAARQARQARSQRRQRGRPATRRSPLRWIPAWLAALFEVITRRRGVAADGRPAQWQVLPEQD